MATKKKAAKKKVAKKKSTTKTSGATHDMKFAGAYTERTMSPGSFDPEAMGPESLASLINTDVRRPSWKTNKYPVSMSEYKSLIQQAEKMDRGSMQSLAAADDSEIGDTDEDVLALEAVMDDLPEDDSPLVAGPQAMAPAVVSKFETIPSTGWIPPDCVCAAGPSHVLVGVNSEFRIYNKTGSMLSRRAYNTFFSNVLPNQTNVKVFDPRLAWDHYSQRYIMIVAATQNSPQRSWCGVAVSKTTDPMGGWWVYALDAARDGNTATDNWMDYPMLGFDAQAIYIGMNQFKGNNFQYAKLRILNKSEVYAGTPVRWFDFWNLKNPDGSLAFTVQPCCHFRGAGPGPGYMVNNLWGNGNKMTLWTISNPLALWSGGTPVLTKNSIACKSYDLPPQARQKGSATPIATNDNRLLNAIYQHAGTNKRIWTCHNTRISWQGDTEARCAAQWYEIDVPTKKVIQQNAFGQKGSYYFFPVIQTDLRCNAFMLFSRSSATEFACCRLTGRRTAAPLNDMESSVLIKAGESAHLSGRFGDYFGIGRDGSDANRVYGVGEYAESGGNWGTFVVSAKY
ncbi:MAG TPA: hypothetical protein VFX58_06005 [Chitinophagaceae bacterium]|nr:hypothetical protein [Chitinophagaceae bacterium]